MADFSIDAPKNENNNDLQININAPASGTPGAIPETAAPGLAPGQKPNPRAQKSIYGEIPSIPVLDAVDGI
ncbi:MAG: hypothetical protein MJ016_08035, partial [Victivallaceae bacterium]|nr:hypothetical protein [Victivallaceae bacterium]